MKKKIKYMSFYAFEYKALEEYLRNMAKQGWKLIDLQSIFKRIMIFEKCEPQNIYYYVDYNSKYDAIEPQIASPEQKDYRDFLKDYGYEMISTYGPLSVYATASEKQLPLREENEQSIKELRSISKKECLIRLPKAILLFIFIIVFDIAGSMDSTLASHGFLLTYCYALIIISTLLSVTPYVQWLFHKKELYDLKSVMIRIQFHQVIMLTTLVVPMVFLNKFLGFAGILFESFFILRILYYWKKREKISRNLQ